MANISRLRYLANIPCMPTQTKLKVAVLRRRIETLGKKEMTKWKTQEYKWQTRFWHQVPVKTLHKRRDLSLILTTFIPVKKRTIHFRTYATRHRHATSTAVQHKPDLRPTKVSSINLCQIQPLGGWPLCTRVSKSHCNQKGCVTPHGTRHGKWQRIEKFRAAQKVWLNAKTMANKDSGMSLKREHCKGRSYRPLCSRPSWSLSSAICNKIPFKLFEIIGLKYKIILSNRRIDV